MEETAQLLDEFDRFLAEWFTPDSNNEGFAAPETRSQDLSTPVDFWNPENGDWPPGWEDNVPPCQRSAGRVEEEDPQTIGRGSNPKGSEAKRYVFLPYGMAFPLGMEHDVFLYKF